jgi:hypothetical protein
MIRCTVQDSGAVELFFYDELDSAERARVAEHVEHCRECADALQDLAMIRAVLASRPEVSAPAGGDWSSFMARLDSAVLLQDTGARGRPGAVAPFRARTQPTRSYIGLLATAALLALVTINVVFVARQRQAAPAPTSPATALAPAAVDATPVATSGLRSAGEKHFERSKLVVLGLAEREPQQASPADWAYERELATSLLNDTRLYRMAAESRGLNALAGVMRDLELVLLETSMAEDSDPAALEQIQRLIRKRGLIQKMDTVAHAGM